MADAATITGNKGFSPVIVSGLPSGSEINLTGLSVTVNNSKNPLPTASKDCSVGTLQTNFYGVTILSCPKSKTRGGRIAGIVPMTSEWNATYCGSACGYRISNSPGAEVRNVRIDRSWDALRVIYSPGFLFEDIYVPITRDDFLEDDVQEGGTIRDILVEGCLNGVSCVPSSNPRKVTTEQTIIMENILLRLKKFNQSGTMTHGTPFKYDTTTKSIHNPKLVLRNCVIAIEHVGHNGKSRLKQAWSKVKEATNCFYLNLSDTKLPSTYPKPPAGFTILQGSAARDKWLAARSAWLSAHPELA